MKKRVLQVKSLSQFEKHLIRKYRQLNHENKLRVQERIQVLLEIQREDSK